MSQRAVYQYNQMYFVAMDLCIFCGFAEMSIPVPGFL